MIRIPTGVFVIGLLLSTALTLGAITAYGALRVLFWGKVSIDLGYTKLTYYLGMTHASIWIGDSHHQDVEYSSNVLPECELPGQVAVWLTFLSVVLSTLLVFMSLRDDYYQYNIKVIVLVISVLVFVCVVVSVTLFNSDCLSTSTFPEGSIDVGYATYVRALWVGLFIIIIPMQCDVTLL